MKECISREAALAALKTYNKEPFHILHGLTVEGVMRWYANELGYGEDADFWATVGLLHDIDFEMWPEQHCRKAPELLKKAGCSEEFIHAVCSHGYGLCCDVEPTHEMEKVLFAADELTGLVGAAARMRPSKSVMDMEVSSLKKKYKDKKFAAGCSSRASCSSACRLCRGARTAHRRQQAYNAAPSAISPPSIASLSVSRRGSGQQAPAGHGAAS